MTRRNFLAPGATFALAPRLRARNRSPGRRAQPGRGRGQWDQRRGPWKRVPVVVPRAVANRRPPFLLPGGRLWRWRRHPATEYALQLERDRNRHVVAVDSRGDLDPE